MKFLEAAPWSSKLLACAAALALTATARAQLDIVIEYDARSSDAPTWDPSGACLTSVVQAAADYWEALFPGVPATQIKFRYRWYDFYAHSHIGLSPYHWGESEVWADTRRRSGGLFTPNSYTCRFWTVTTAGETPWFVDDDPAEHSEFDMTPRMYEWPSDAGTLLGLTTVPPGDVEVGFEGPARADDVATSSCSMFAAPDGVDLFSVALHEMGHAIGLGFRGEGDANADGDYDVWSPVHTGGTGVEAVIDSSGSLDVAHLHADHALMNPGISIGKRRLPSMIDILVMADINGWTTFDLPRTYRESTPGTIAWSASPAWLDAVLPGRGVGAVLYSQPGDDDVYLSASTSADGVYIGDGSALDVGTRTLDAGERVSLAPYTSLSIGGGSVTCGELIHHGDVFQITNAGSLFASNYVEADGSAEIRTDGTAGAMANLDVPGGVVRLRGSAALLPSHTEVQAALLDLDGNSTRVEGGVTQFAGLLALVNDGLISASNGDLEFHEAGLGVFFDLDGDQDAIGNPELGRIDALGGSISFDAPALDPFGGTMRIGATRSITVATSLPVDSGTIQFTGDNSHLFPGNLDMRSGSVEVNGPIGTDGFIHGQQTWWMGASASVDLGNVLHLLGVSTYKGGMVALGDGTVRQAGDAFVDVGAGATIIDVARYVWDGEKLGGGPGPYSTTTVRPGATLRITGVLGCGVAGDGFDGVVHVKSSALLFVEQNWVLEGELVLEGGSVIGGTITNRGTIRGFGNIATTVVNNGAIECDPPGLTWIGGALVAGTGVCEPGCEP